MDVWLTVLGFVLFLGFFVADCVTVSAIKRKEQILVKSRLHHKLGVYEVVLCNICLIGSVVCIYFHFYIFIPAVLATITFVILLTKVVSGITDEGALVDTSFIEWEFMKSYKLVYDENDGSTITLKIRANSRQYVLVCEREDKHLIEEIFRKHRIKVTETV